eukprot:CAMPEP_0114359556 /NCGR_PEP_ID=MMETSP0101-20121206/23110_1 /TAXON_ID=38822 ORGANISM="Pteridomonas danica, Strain PT" /NCGR_SAMPLE_ID=MMETSP0101 /ASSEMBLY_ACC=CAM_ASM_000211 /LENGTH=295 /DNA_ID=CAMNT_0001503167 /DNA_START=151 /DNA_END=1038 /DNA_ORIENTATION=-
MTLFDVPDEDEEDADRKALKEITQRAAVVLQQCWQKRPKWTQPHALLKMVEAIDSRPKSAQEVSKDERKRLSDLGLIIPASLSYGETPIPEFLAILKRVSTIREDANGGVAEGSIIGRLEGVFYDVGCGIGTLCFAAAIRHNFSHVVGIEILQGLFDVASDLERHFNLSVKPRMFARIDKVPTKLRFVIGDACAVKWLQIPPSVVFCHCSLFDAELMMKLAAKLSVLPCDALIVTITHPVPAYTTPSGRETIIFAVIERMKVQMPWGPATAFIQQRRLTEQEEYEIERMKFESDD